MEKVLRLLAILSDYSNQYEKTNTDVSDVSVGWHIEHSCLVISRVVDTIIKSNATEYSWNFSFKKMIVLALNKFPRGKAKAPKSVMPGEQINLDSIQKNISEAKEALTKLTTAQKNQFFTHPVFGKVNKKDSFKFFVVHTNHHIKIIQDILASQ
jgi:hypothetical protein